MLHSKLELLCAHKVIHHLPERVAQSCCILCIRGDVDMQYGRHSGEGDAE